MNNPSIENYTTDLYELIKYSRTVIRNQRNSEKIKHTESMELLHNLDLTFSNQMNELEDLDTLNEGTLKKLKDSAAKGAGKISGLVDSVRDDTASKMLRDDYTMLSMIAAGYTMLHTAALGKGNSRLADFTQESLTRIAQLITETSRILPHIVAEEMHITEIASKAEENTQEAWDPANFLVE